MTDADDLVEIESGLPDLAGAVLLHALDGFVDAGSAVAAARAHLLDGRSPIPVARFDVDRLVDYRARRPLLRFEHDHWSDYDDPQLVVQLLYDEREMPFLLLSGPEPDVQWERFVRAVRALVERLGVRLTVGLNAFPLGIPHTRPARMVLHGSRPELFAGYQPWLGQILVPASAGHLLEYRLGAAGHDTLGVSVPVPAYLAQASYPAAALALVQEVCARTGLSVAVTNLEQAATQARANIDAQIAESQEARDVVHSLEEQYDAYVRNAASAGTDSPLAEVELPSADELGAELERFLADQRRRDEH